MSASDTGEDEPLVQFFNLVRNSDSASAPASRTVSFSRCASRALASAKRQSLDAHCRRVDAVAELQIVGWNHGLEDSEQMTRNGYLAYRIGDLAVLDPEAGRAAAVVTSDTVDAGTDQVGDVEALLDVAHQLGWRQLAGLEVQVVRTGRGRRGHTAMGVAGGLEPELARGRGIEQPRGQHTLIDDRELLHHDALGVERLRAQATLAQGIVDDADIVGKQLLTEAILQEARLARDRGAVDGVDEMADQRTGNAGVEQHGYFASFD